VVLYIKDMRFVNCALLFIFFNQVLTAQVIPASGDFQFTMKAEARIYIGFMGAVGFSANLAAGVTQRLGNFQWGGTAAVNLYQGGIGAVLSSQNRQFRGKNQFNTDIILSGSATLGDGRHDTLPLLTFNHAYPAVVLQGYKKSITHAQNFVFNFRGRHQRVGTYGFKLYNVYLQLYNDVDIFLGDADDRFWTGGGSISVYLTDSYYFAFGTDVFTGERNPLRSSHPQNPPRGYPYEDYDQAPGDQQLNIGKLFLQLNSYEHNFNFEIARTGRRDMTFQNIIHKWYGTPYYESTAANQWNVGVGIQHHQD